MAEEQSSQRPELRGVPARGDGKKRGDEILRLKGITKRFPGVTALDDVSFNLRAGEVHVVLGENGAGKSTLINVVAGTYSPDEGTMTFLGEEVRHLSPHDARAKGINAVFQDFSLVPMLSVEENLLLGHEPGRLGVIDRPARRREAMAALNRVSTAFTINVRIDTLPRADQQLVEIAKALIGEPRVLILDEPTTSLTEKETELLFELIEELKGQGLGLIYITHRMREIGRIGDRVTVLRDGRYVETLEIREASDDRLLDLMAGRTLTTLYPRAPFEPREVRLHLDHVTSRNLEDVSIEVCAGEVVGVAGLVGSGKSDIGRLCFGLEPVLEGQIQLDGVTISKGLEPDKVLAHGLIYYPADRRGEGLVLMRPARENLSLAALDQPDYSRLGFLNRRQERQNANEIITRLRVHPADPERRAAYFSGGNQQKLVLGRALTRKVGVHIFDEPTAGIDVGARIDVYEFIRELCEEGSAILLISSDLSEVIHVSHRVYVIHHGQVRAELVGESISEERVLANLFDRDKDEP